MRLLSTHKHWRPDHRDATILEGALCVIHGPEIDPEPIKKKVHQHVDETIILFSQEAKNYRPLYKDSFVVAED